MEVTTGTGLGLVRAQVVGGDSRSAASALARALGPAPSELAVCFASPKHNLDAVAETLRASAPGALWTGCTTAGEFGPKGCSKGALVGFVLRQSHFRATLVPVGAVAQLDLAALDRNLRDGLDRLDRSAALASGRPTRSFAMLLVDGLSLGEERLASAAQAALGSIPLVGGSAGDDLCFAGTAVWNGERFASDQAVLALVRTDLSMRILQAQHFRAGAKRLVVTAAEPDQRRVRELDAEPAAEAYARALGVARKELTPEVYSRHPLVVRIAGRDCIRSVGQVRADGSLDFFCAIDEGLVLSVAERADPVAELESALRETSSELGDPIGLIGFDCVLRQLEVSADGHVERLSQLFRAHRAVGFATYGEQIAGLHLNQTFTGILLGHPAP